MSWPSNLSAPEPTGSHSDKEAQGLAKKQVTLAELRERNADIVCLQEFDLGSYDICLYSSLAHTDYIGVFWPKSRARTMAEKEAKWADGCATFYKNSECDLIDKHHVGSTNTAINRLDMEGEHDVFDGASDTVTGRVEL
ncbi:hypothetical protein BU16DRAFT_554069 [Lophium mytilinum]|uniref:Endonuclease/exonuclease/phosphatase domain-containing protein n=1 Tax=Lophium mytilinum TaxID=390894 RepID=A0A6A6RCB1_9PEZI|nr:hypothetical protein BU16DRAFT_554069 [Lophium mytilinum]